MVGRIAAPIALLVDRQDGREVQLVHQVAEQIDLMVGGQPVAQVRRQRQGTVGLVRAKGALGHRLLHSTRGREGTPLSLSYRNSDRLLVGPQTSPHDAPPRSAVRK